MRPASASGEYGPDVPLQTIATTAGVGPATLFRNFSDKEQLVLAALNRQLRLNVDPVIDVALAGPDAAEGLFRVIDAIMTAASENANLLGAVAGRRDLLTGITGSLIESVGDAPWPRPGPGHAPGGHLTDGHGASSRHADRRG